MTGDLAFPKYERRGSLWCSESGRDEPLFPCLSFLDLKGQNLPFLFSQKSGWFTAVRDYFRKIYLSEVVSQCARSAPFHRLRHVTVRTTPNHGTNVQMEQDKGRFGSLSSGAPIKTKVRLSLGESQR